MNDKEMIEEMAKDIPFLTLDREVFVGATEKKKVGWTLSEEDNEVIAESLIKQNYRNCKDKVVLTKEKYINGSKSYSNATLKSWKKEDLIEHIRILEHNWASAEKCIDNQAKNYEMLLNQARKETAKEILNDLTSVIHENRQYGNNFVVVFFNDLKELAKQYGVEVEE